MPALNRGARSTPALPRRRRVQELVDDWWPAACTLALIVASDYKLRTRSPSDAMAASVDSSIILELGLYGLVAGFLLARAGGPRLARPPVQVYFACCWVGLMALSLLYTPNPTYATVRVAQMVVVLALVVAEAARGRRDQFHRLAHGFLALIVVSVLYGLAVPSPPANAKQVGRFTWLAIHPTTSGVLTGLGFLVAVAYVAGGRRARPGPHWSQAGYLAALVVTAGGLLGTQTRGAIIGAAAGTMVLVLSLRRGRAVIEAALAAVLIVVGLTLAVAGPVADYFVRNEDPESLATLNSRTDLWDAAEVAISREPVYGYGVNAAQSIFYDETGLGGGHNAVVNVTVELGVVGLLAWGGLVVTLLVGTRRLPRDGSDHMALDRGLLLAVQVFLLVDGVVHQGPAATTNVAATWLLTCVAWLAVAERSAAVAEGRRPRRA